MLNQNSEIYELIFNKKIKKDSNFDQQLNIEYVMYQKKRSEELLLKKIDNELYLSELKKKLNYLFYPSLGYCIYCILFSSINIITLFAFLIFFASKSYYAIKKLKLSKYINPKSYNEIKLLSDEQFIESYASKELLDTYKEEVGNEKFQEVLFKSGSDIKKIKIKDLKV